MTSIRTHHAVEASSATPAVATWLTSTDHKVVGRLYIGAGLVGLLGGLVLAVLVAFERIDAEGYLVRDGARVRTVHPGEARGTDCLAARLVRMIPDGSGDCEWDCGCFTPVPHRR